MFKIIRKQKLNEFFTKIDIQADIIVPKWRPGQHVAIMADHTCQRLVFNAVDVDSARGVLSVTFENNSPSTDKLVNVKIGQELYSLVGPLGQPFEIKHYGRVACLAENLQVASMLPICRELKAQKNRVFGIASFDDRKRTMLETPLRINCNRIHVTNNESSYYKKVTWQEALQSVLEENDLDLIYADGSLEFLQEIKSLVGSKKVCLMMNLLSAVYGTQSVFDHTALKLDRKEYFVNTDGLMIDASDINIQPLARTVEVLKEFNACQKAQLPRKNRASASGIFPKWLSGLVGAKQ